MKRAARFSVVLPILLFLLHFSPVPPAALAQGADCTEKSMRAWVNDLRRKQGLPELRTEALLERTAAAYAADLERRGVLSHVDELGRRALERLQAGGGTTVLVGEILGSGADPASVTAAWEESASHREVLLNPLWTHCGAASVSTGGTTIWVVLFTSHRIYPLEIRRCADGFLVQGRLASDRAKEPVLISGIEPIDPLNWDSASREFSFFVSEKKGAVYHRLGYRSDEDALVITDTFYPIRAAGPGSGASEAATSGREKECR
jgi:hypothetical protein